jgi:uncharacterized protein YutE (UPF0331/DUF86 family)
MDDIFLNKQAAIERCLKRVREEYGNDPINLKNITRQDAIVLNLQRACESAIDLAMHAVSIRKLGVPKETREAFQFLADAGLLPVPLADRLKKMVGFRNVAVHDYQSLDLAILTHILEERLGDFEELLRAFQKTFS